MSASTFTGVCVIYDRGEKHDQEGHGSRAVAAALRTGGIDADAYVNARRFRLPSPACRLSGGDGMICILDAASRTPPSSSSRAWPTALTGAIPARTAP
jgi:hypothetical protein